MERAVPLDELPKDVCTVVDLTSEHLEDPAIRQTKRYVCLPTLDGSVPALDELSALVAACLVVLGGFADNVDDAMTRMKESA